jgi:glycine/D-amino acid oxidase-like deaminating enzyme
MFESWRRASLDAAALLRRMRIHCGLEAADALIAAGPQGERVLRREHDAREAAGLDGSWLAGRQVRQSLRLDQGAAIRMHGAFGLDPFRACLGLAAAAIRRGARFHEQSPVTAIRPAARHVDVAVKGGTVRASTVIVATGAATAEFKPLQRHFKRRELFHALTEPVPAAVRRQLFGHAVALRDVRDGRLQVRWTPDHRLVISGADLDATPQRRRDEVLVQRTGQLMYETLTRYPAISGLRPTHGWDMAYGATADGLPFIGAHRNYPRHLFALGGDGGSMTGAFLAARILARAVQGAPHKGDEVFGWTR